MIPSSTNPVSLAGRRADVTGAAFFLASNPCRCVTGRAAYVDAAHVFG